MGSEPDFLDSAMDEEPIYDFFGGREAWIKRFPEVRAWLNLLNEKTA